MITKGDKVVTWESDGPGAFVGSVGIDECRARVVLEDGGKVAAALLHPDGREIDTISARRWALGAFVATTLPRIAALPLFEVVAEAARAGDTKTAEELCRRAIRLLAGLTTLGEEAQHLHVLALGYQFEAPVAAPFFERAAAACTAQSVLLPPPATLPA